MTLARRFDEFGCEHPRANLLTGLLVGAVSATGIVIAALWAGGVEQPVDLGRATESRSAGLVEPATGVLTASTASMADPSAIGVDPYGGLVEQPTGALPASAAELGTSRTSAKPMPDPHALGVDPYGGFVEPSAGALPSRAAELGNGRFPAESMADPNALGVDPYGGFVEPS